MPTCLQETQQRQHRARLLSALIVLSAARCCWPRLRRRPASRGAVAVEREPEPGAPLRTGPALLRPAMALRLGRSRFRSSPAAS
jgi:hypothetical protein